MPKSIRLNTVHYFVMKIPSKRELQQIMSNQSPHVELKDFMKLHEDYTEEPFLFLVNDANLSSDNLLRYRTNLSKNVC